jgi:PIN domain nuclease of toxin-antitoxin system
MSGSVLDASAILAVVNDEPGAQRVTAALAERALLSAVNYAEIMTKLIERGLGRTEASALVRSLGVALIDFDAELAERAAELRVQTKRFGLSLADRACLALAERETLPAVTADRSWRDAGLDVEIRTIR